MMLEAVASPSKQMLGAVVQIFQVYLELRVTRILNP